jgi:hypothetical protein
VARLVGRHIADVTPKMQIFSWVMTERHMASHPSVTRCDVSAPYRHTVTSRHTPLRGVTDVTCDAGVRDHRFHRRAYRPVARRTEPYQPTFSAAQSNSGSIGAPTKRCCARSGKSGVN